MKKKLDKAYTTVYFFFPGVIALVLFQGISDLWLRTSGVTFVAILFLYFVRRILLERRRLLQDATLDELTGLGNYRAFKERIKLEADRTLRKNSPLALLLIDLDQFKNYNDSYGHQKGNELLRRTGQSLREAVRNMDGVYRFGGDEFAVVLPDTTIQDSWKVAKRIYRVYDKLPARGTVTLSMGMATYRANEETLEEFFERVDHLLYCGKEQGGGSCQVDTSERFLENDAS